MPNESQTKLKELIETINAMPLKPKKLIIVENPSENWTEGLNLNEMHEILEKCPIEIIFTTQTDLDSGKHNTEGAMVFKF